MNETVYFAPLLPWQQSLWQRMTSASLQQDGKLAHALLASGIEGIGKRAFIWRWVAWQLCDNKHHNTEVACGHCQSCQWLKAGTHPDLAVLPLTSLLKTDETDTVVATASKKSNKKTKTAKPAQPRIKIDDIRSIQDFVHQGSSSLRICVFDYAEKMTIAAANALLKTLEEPKTGIQLILISNKPDALLPTIKSRVQQLALTDINQSQAIEYVKHSLNQIGYKDTQATAEVIYDDEKIQQLLIISANAPLKAVSMAQSKWYAMRELWLTTWQALRSYSRMPVMASDYWQTQLSINEFIELSQVMLADVQRLIFDLPAYQKDIDYSAILNNLPEMQNCIDLCEYMQSAIQSLAQNIQEKLVYDDIMQMLRKL
ncbi:MAG: DNA polymerase III subunit delta' [Gammaproteobacteria bacterium]|nr:MAG: DNA polymerase III subunit delta' [Gammaproteobacteria bacterium]